MVGSFLVVLGFLWGYLPAWLRRAPRSPCYGAPGSCHRGGLGGPSAAIHLAHRGAQVVLFEKGAALGGKARAILRDPRLVQIADRYATYNGSDPFQAPATLNPIFWVENGLGVFYLAGRMYRLVEALGQLAAQKGVELRLHTPVHRILVKNDRVTGVETEAGFFPAQVVVSGVDVRTTYRQLLGRSERCRFG